MKLKGYRVMLGLTQKKMADRLDISLQSYNNKELGKTPFNDKERLLIKSMVTKIKPDITIDELFYSWKTDNKKGSQSPNYQAFFNDELKHNAGKPCYRF